MLPVSSFGQFEANGRLGKYAEKRDCKLRRKTKRRQDDEQNKEAMYYGQIALASDLMMGSNDGSESTTES
jgi:hypothetical protein